MFAALQFNSCPVQLSETTNDFSDNQKVSTLLDNQAQELVTFENVCARNKSLNSVPISIAEILGVNKIFEIFLKRNKNMFWSNFTRTHSSATLKPFC